MDESVKKTILIVLIVLSFFPLIFTIGTDLSLYGDFSTYLHFSKTAAYIGFLTLWWGYVLGIRRFIGNFIKDLPWLMTIHKWFNIVGYPIVLAHPIALLVSGLYDIPSLLPYFTFITEDGILWTRVYIIGGSVAFILWSVIYYTSAIVKKRLLFRFWKFVHLFTYPIFFITFFHIQAGFLQTTVKLFDVIPILQIYNWSLFIAFTLLVLWQLSGVLGLTKAQYKIVQIVKRAQGVVSLRLQPLDPKQTLVPVIGQHLYLQRRVLGESHPFSVSQYDEESKTIELTIKNLGRFSGNLQLVKQDQKVYLDGPYGTFAREMLDRDRPIVMLAGGIGVTPFMYAISQMETNVKLQDKSLYLIYGNKTLQDVAFGQELHAQQQKFSNLHVTHVLDSEPTFEGEKGFITMELIEKYVYENLEDCDFFVCGPPIMIEKLTATLLERRILPSHIFTEKFSN